ncbi:hypothetical protein BpHYR1_040984 [Brachionus plicatilis]|uniref:Uncharacterized protein n=1 Tax=Brachionus plicatilis TaxID=10195 RepID=A0A3M7R6C8_BRAPC|nr:hypothetical protein BpHYR1_040984 [Brachionus plicatilis]
MCFALFSILQRDLIKYHSKADAGRMYMTSRLSSGFLYAFKTMFHIYHFHKKLRKCEVSCDLY